MSRFGSFERFVTAATIGVFGACATQAERLDLKSDFVSRGTVACAPIMERDKNDKDLENARFAAIAKAREAIAKRVCGKDAGGALFDIQATVVTFDDEQVCEDVTARGEIICGDRAPK